MIDEHVTRYWTDAHSEFTGDLDRGLLRLGSFLKRRLRSREVIGEAYARETLPPGEPGQRMNSTARATLAGLTACAATSAVLVAVALIASSCAVDIAPLHTATAGYPLTRHALLA